MATDAVTEEFITIVPVGENRPPVIDSSFVTVLTVGAAAGAAEVVVRRPRGARLGLGLKFEGGSAAVEKVRRLLVQSCAEDSPAANAVTPWGTLIPGDEILAIDGVSVCELTRIDCVRRLKDSDETLTLFVRHFDSNGMLEKSTLNVTDNASQNKQTEIVRPTSLPPPVPPRKLGKKNSFKDKSILQTVGEYNTDGLNQIHNGKENGINLHQNGISTLTKLSRKSSFDSHLFRQNKESIVCLKKGSPEEVRRLVRRLSDGKTMPPDAEVYIDLLSSEWERCLLLADAESDDTGSSISTVVDRLSSMASSVENSIPSTPTMQQKTIDIQKVLNCIENIDSNILKDITSNRLLERKDFSLNEMKVEKIQNNHELSTVTNEVKVSKPMQQSDKNNNNMLLENVSCILDENKTCSELVEKSELKPEPIIEKPKPMPRTTKVERSLSEKKPRPIPVPATSPLSDPEPLLTPTKKNCIESWLQRSEAEMNIKNVEKIEESSVPEALPRLIDFVPKPQFKENGEAAALARPTSAPPPPPTEAREDGSGASLDTIGELDENIDVTDSPKPIVIEAEHDRKPSLERSFWEDRSNKSDAEDKSLSNDETPLPTCPRQPPDGVETPFEMVEKTPELPTRLPPRLPVWSNTRTRFSYISRTQDARSEASVKDKIAMFSNDHSTSTDHLDKCDTLPTRNSTVPRKSTLGYTNNYSEVSSLDRRLTKSQDNLDELPRSNKKHVYRSEAMGAVETPTIISYGNNMVNNKRSLQNKPLFYGSTTTLPLNVETSYTQPIYHTRSVSDDNGNKNVHKSNLDYLIEQRKKTMSKLRGLVIPEGQAPIIDLPEIKVQDNLTKSFLTKSSPVAIKTKQNKTSNSIPINLIDSKWKPNLMPNNLPKYSPAFKRKSLQVYTPTSALSKESTPERKFNEKVDSLNRINNLNKPLRGSLDGVNIASTLPYSKISTTNLSKLSNKDYKQLLNNVRDFKNVEIKICTATDIVDSDNDSAMSSTQSSYRSSASSPMHNMDTLESDNSRLSPRISHYATYSSVKMESLSKSSIMEKSEEYARRAVCRSVSSDTNVSISSSAGSAATSGSQASCSSLESSVADSDKKKVSKSYNIDTINRRNILASAKCRSGRDVKLKSPVVETKFSHESSDRSPSPTPKPSDRLPTLTPSVSVVSNKGENRRRNKVIAETDSDSDSEINIRQRKTEFKNTRLKRNSSSGSKNKQNEMNLDSPKAEDAPRVITEKIIKEIKEIKKAGLDNFNINNKHSDKCLIKIKPIASITRVKDEHVIKKDIVLTPHRGVDVVDNNISNKPNSNKIIPNNMTNGKNDCNSSEEIKHSSHIVRLKRGVCSGVGLILAGGIDCEAKDVTVHRVLSDSIAEKAGLKRGAKVLSINGLSMTGVTHAQSVTILKEQRSEVVIEVENEFPENGKVSDSDKAESTSPNNLEVNGDVKGSIVTVVLEKAGGGAGLGFGLDGGRDSPQGDRPLTIKKLFAGGAAAQSGRVLVGAELLSAGGQSVESFTRTQAWAALKALPTGPVALVLRNPKKP